MRKQHRYTTILSFLLLLSLLSTSPFHHVTQSSLFANAASFLSPIPPRRHSTTISSSTFFRRNGSPTMITTPKTISSHRRNRPSKLYETTTTQDSQNNDDDLDLETTIRSMRAKELKSELQSLGIATDDVFEKDELVKRLIDARRRNPDASRSEAPPSSSTSSSSSSSSSPNVIQTPLEFYSLETSKSVTAAKSSLGTTDVSLRPSEGQFAAIRLHLPSLNQSLVLLADTACSGLVLRPSSVRNYSIPTVKSPMTMMAAGGTNTAGQGMAQLDRFAVGNREFGPLPAAVQDIGALPSALDGIIGMSFLGRFPYVDFDFRQRQLLLHQHRTPPPSMPSFVPLVAETPLTLTRMGVYVADFLLDNNPNPIKLLVDTGAASTIFNWKGIADLKLSKHSLSRNTSPIGAMGADNVALELTHRLVLRDSIKAASSKNAKGIDLTSKGPLEVDVGDIPILKLLENEGVGGILGADLIMRCDVVRFAWDGKQPTKVMFFQE